jgi:hypothetical protein
LELRPAASRRSKGGTHSSRLRIWSCCAPKGFARRSRSSVQGRVNRRGLGFRVQGLGFRV